MYFYRSNKIKLSNYKEYERQCITNGSYCQSANTWLTGNYDEVTKNEIRRMIDADDKTELIECFYRDLEFGTGGLRGIMGAGTNRMNIYTVGAATQGLSNYLKAQFPNVPQISVVIGQ